VVRKCQNYQIKQDEQSGICKKWEEMHKKLCNTLKQIETGCNEEEEEEEEMDTNMLY